MIWKVKVRKLSFSAAARQYCARWLAVLALFVSADNACAQNMLTAPRFDTVLFWGADSAMADRFHTDNGIGAGFVTALNSDIGRPGWIITSSAGFSRTKSTLNWTSSFYSSILLGHQWTGPAYYFSTSAGLHQRNNKEYPAGSPTDGKSNGLTIQYSFETKTPRALYFHSFGSYSTIETQLYFHSKLGYRTQRLRLGGEFTIYDDATNPPAYRYGAFIGNIPLIRDMNVTLAAGYRSKLGEPDGFYTTASFTLPIKLRP